MPRLTWTYSQRRVLLVLLSVLCVALIVRYALHPVYVSDPQPPVPARFSELADRIDPNTADWQTLAALPGIGERRAKDIVAYRERERARAIISGMQDHLIVPTTSPATAPTSRRSATAPGL